MKELSVSVNSQKTLKMINYNLQPLKALTQKN